MLFIIRIAFQLTCVVAYVTQPTSSTIFDFIKGCSYTCATCSSATYNQASQCLTCPTTRTLSSGQCPCNAGYYDDGSSNTCPGSNYIICKLAPTHVQPVQQHQVLHAHHAQPEEHSLKAHAHATVHTLIMVLPPSLLLVKVYINKNMKACSYTCLTCTGATSTNCLTCPSTRTLTSSSCPCNNGYFDNGVPTCANYQCSYTCATCTSISQCTACPSTRTLISGQCQCNTGFFDNRVATCIACSYTCYSCTGTSTSQCSTCPISRNITSSSCPCNDGLSDYGFATCTVLYSLQSWQSQQSCSYTCASCTAAPNSQCQTCSSTRTLISGSCPCNGGYFDDGNNNICASCSYTCSNCTADSNSSCLTCHNDSNRIMLLNSCLCSPGYFDDGTIVCMACFYACETCQSQLETSCISCSSLKFRTLINGSCLCKAGYYYGINNSLNNSQPLCSNKCGDGIKTISEDCDDGNTASHDGCSSQCTVESGYNCVQVFNLSSNCSEIQIPNCLLVQIDTELQVNFESQIQSQCILCQENYYLSINATCLICHLDCNGCIGPRSNQCKKCSGMAVAATTSLLSLPGSVNCESCSLIPGLHTSPSGQCQSYCGDGIIRFDKGEMCDDGNDPHINGCTSDCQVNPLYTCVPQQTLDMNSDQNYLPGPSTCKIKAALQATFLYKDDQTDDKMELAFDHVFDQFLYQRIRQSDFCHRFNLSIESLEDDQYSIQILEQTHTTCSIKMTFKTSLLDNQMIQLKFNGTITSNDGLKLQQTLLRLNSREYTFYTPQQINQARQVKKSQQDLNKLILILGIIIIFFGGIEFYLSVLDIMTWVDTLYYINVNFPINIKLFFQFAQWTDIFQIPNPIQLNQPSDDYYQQGPLRFSEKGFGGNFIASLLQDIYFCLIALIIFLISTIFCKFSEKIYTKPQLNGDISINNTEGFLHIKSEILPVKTQLVLPYYVKPFYQYCSKIINNKLSIAIKLLLLVYLDFQTASLLQIQAGQVFRHPFITLNYVLALLFQALGFYLPFYFFQIVNKSPNLLENEIYQQKYGAVYEGLIVKIPKMKWYCIFLSLKKSFFIFFLVAFYTEPIMQTISCTFACCVNIIMICMKNPFHDVKTLVRNIIPEIGILGAITITIIFAVDDQIQILSKDQKFNLGWLTLFFVGCTIMLQCMFLINLLAQTGQQRFKMLKECLQKKKVKI